MKKNYGLSSHRAKMALLKREKASSSKKDRFAGIFADYFASPILRVFLAALVVNIILVILNGEALKPLIGIAAALFVYLGAVSFLETLSEEASRRPKGHCRVYRDGIIAEVSLDEIVEGDAILLQKGDIVPGDGILLEGKIKLDQSPLTGDGQILEKEGVYNSLSEDEPDSEEELDYADKKLSEEDFSDANRVFSGSVVLSGNAVFQITALGDTMKDKRDKEFAYEEEMSSLKLRLADLAGKVSSSGHIFGIIIGAVVIFRRLFIENNFYMYSVYQYMSRGSIFVSDIMQAIMLGCAIIIICSPDGLSRMVSAFCALNAGRMRKNGVIPVKTSGLEAAGALRLLIADKTGVFTTGEPQWVVFVDGMNNVYAKIGEITEGLKEVLLKNILCNTSAVISDKAGGTELLSMDNTVLLREKSIFGGTALERAMIKFAERDIPEELPEALARIEYESGTKMSAATIDGGEEEGLVTLIKGVPEKIIGRCGYYYAENGKKLILDEESREELFYKIEMLATKGVRVIAFATADEEITGEQIPMHGNWAFVGIAGFTEDIRPGALQAVRELQTAGVQTVMVTGDEPEAAKVSAEEAGLLYGFDDVVLSADEFNSMTDNEVRAIFPRLKVLARASSADKARLLSIAKSLDTVVGATGATVEDIPNLLAADVGFSLLGGKDSAKEASHIILGEAGIGSAVKALLYGRTAFNNVRKFIVFRLTLIFSAIAVSLVIPALGRDVPLTVIQLIWAGFIANILGEFMFMKEAPMKKYLREKPKSRRQRIVSPAMRMGIITGIVWVVFVSLMLFLSPLSRIFQGEPGLLSGYMAFFVFAHVFNALNARTDNSNIFGNMDGNPAFSRILAGISIVQILIVCLGGTVFRTTALSAGEWLTVLVAAFLIIPVDAVRKYAYGNKPEETDEVDLSLLLMDMEKSKGAEAEEIPENAEGLPDSAEEISAEEASEAAFEENITDTEELFAEDNGEPDTVFEDIDEIGDKTLEEVISQYEEAFPGEAEPEIEFAEEAVGEVEESGKISEDAEIKEEVSESGEAAEKIEETPAAAEEDSGDTEVKGDFSEMAEAVEKAEDIQEAAEEIPQQTEIKGEEPETAGAFAEEPEKAEAAEEESEQAEVKEEAPQGAENAEDFSGDTKTVPQEAEIIEEAQGLTEDLTEETEKPDKRMELIDELFGKPVEEPKAEEVMAEAEENAVQKEVRAEAKPKSSQKNKKPAENGSKPKTKKKADSENSGEAAEKQAKKAAPRKKTDADKTAGEKPKNQGKKPAGKKNETPKNDE